METEQYDFGQHTGRNPDQKIRIQQRHRNRDGKDQELIFPHRENPPKDPRLAQSPSDVDEDGSQSRTWNPIDQFRSHP